MWYRFFFLNIFLFFLKTDSTELFRAFELRASIRISQKKKSRNNSIIQQSISFLLLLQCTCKSETMGGCKVTIPVSRGTRLSFQSDTCLRSMLIRPGLSDELFSSVLSHRYPPSHNGCSIQAPQYSLCPRVINKPIPVAGELLRSVIFRTCSIEWQEIV